MMMQGSQPMMMQQQPMMPIAGQAYQPQSYIEPFQVLPPPESAAATMFPSEPMKPLIPASAPLPAPQTQQLGRHAPRRSPGCVQRPAAAAAAARSGWPGLQVGPRGPGNTR